MNRDLALSALAAAAIHGGLLFGYNPTATPRPLKTTDAIKLEPLPQIKPDNPEPEIVRSDDKETVKKPEPLARVSTLEDHPKIPNPGDITTPYKPTPEVMVPGLESIPHEYGRGPIGSKPQIFSIVELDRAPRTRSQIAPTYPFEAKRAGLSGIVNVEFTVDENGRVSDPKIVASTDPLFEQATINAVLKWRFEPGTRQGERVRFRMIAPVQFTLHE